jgi:hypothetical protein
MILKRLLFTVAAMFATVVAERSVTAPPAAAARPTVDQVIRWNRTLLQIIHTPGAQPATVHPARNLAIMTSVKYTVALQEVQRQGEVHSAARAADQTQVANVWAAPIQNTGMRSHRGQRTSFSAAVREAGLSRIYAGQHARLGQTSGIALAVTSALCSATTVNLAERWV